MNKSKRSPDNNKELILHKQIEVERQILVHTRNCKNFETNKKPIDLNVLFNPHKKRQIGQTYISKHNFEHSNQVTLLMITKGEKWHSLAVKNWPSLLREITSIHNDDYYCINCLYSFRTESKLNSPENVCKYHDHSHTIMSEKYHKILKHSQDKKSLKTPFVIFADTESMLEKIHACNNPEESSTVNELTCSV